MFFYRNINGERKKFKFLVDRTATIIKEVEVKEKEDTLPLTRRSVSKDGKVVINKISQEDIDRMKFFVPGYECNFEGCEDLKKSYEDELEKMGGNNCKACAKGALIRKYMAKLDKLLPQ